MDRQKFARDLSLRLLAGVTAGVVILGLMALDMYTLQVPGPLWLKAGVFGAVGGFAAWFVVRRVFPSSSDKAEKSE